MKLKYEISRFRSIINTQVIELDSNKINVVIGTNGSGKSNFLDAIRWFSGENIENIKSQKTEFHPNHSIHNLYLDDPEILYDGELVEYERDTIYKLLIKKGEFAKKQVKLN